MPAMVWSYLFSTWQRQQHLTKLDVLLFFLSCRILYLFGLPFYSSDSFFSHLYSGSARYWLLNDEMTPKYLNFFSFLSVLILLWSHLSWQLWTSCICWQFSHFDLSPNGRSSAVTADVNRSRMIPWYLSSKNMHSWNSIHQNMWCDHLSCFCMLSEISVGIFKNILRIETFTSSTVSSWPESLLSLDHRITLQTNFLLANISLLQSIFNKMARAILWEYKPDRSFIFSDRSNDFPPHSYKPNILIIA